MNTVPKEIVEEIQRIKERITERQAQRGYLENTELEMMRIIEENERITKERDELIEVDRQRDHKYREGGETIDELRSELAAKDKVLEWYAVSENIEDTDDLGERARSILSQYAKASTEASHG